ncbi:hypothetical protein H6F50_21255 [Coleofasciculus sp. FACHB-712]|nr:hypothetical protein [Coleofasciculus sp. FACHB-712]MBD1944854.1 hypothetical protein [Coleofasciculus sp. FACHB-712]
MSGTTRQARQPLPTTFTTVTRQIHKDSTTTYPTTPADLQRRQSKTVLK